MILLQIYTKNGAQFLRKVAAIRKKVPGETVSQPINYDYYISNLLHIFVVWIFSQTEIIQTQSPEVTDLGKKAMKGTTLVPWFLDIYQW